MSSKVLLVDDDRAALYALRELLSGLGAQILLAESGEDALRLVLKHQFAAIRSLERSRQTPIIFMSAHDDRRRRVRAGAQDYLRKPLAPALVRSKVAGLLERHGADPDQCLQTMDLPHQSGLGHTPSGHY
jgi:CheY-like chemotaxis protein